MKNHPAARIALFLFAASLVSVVVTGCPEWFAKTWSLTVGVTPSGGGTVAKNPARSSYDDGDVVTLAPTAANGYRFDHWSGDLSGSANPGSVTMDEDMTVTAVFVESISDSITDPSGNLNALGDPDRTYIDIIEASIVLEGGQYTLTANVATAFPLAADMTGKRIDILFWVDIDNDVATTQPETGFGNDYNIHLFLDDQGWQHWFLKVDSLSSNDEITYTASDFVVSASGSTATMTFPARYLAPPESEFAWWVSTGTGNAPAWTPYTENPATAHSVFTTSVLP